MNRASGAVAVVRDSESDALYKRLSGLRDDQVQSVRLRFPGAFDEADAEDVVSVAYERVLKTTKRPAAGAEAVWFAQVVTNAAFDELRRRNGRKGAAGNRGGGLRNVVEISVYAQRGKELSSDDLLTDPERVLEMLDEPAERRRATEQTRDALASLSEEDARLLQIRHLELPDASRARCAAAAELTVEAWRHRYKRAWGRFVGALAAAEPTDQCRPTRDLIGALDAGELSLISARDARARVDVHVLECTACRVFARDSYRILVATPAVPMGGGLLERVAQHGSEAATRHAEVVAGGATAGGTGLLALLGAGLSGGGLKAFALVCAVSATAAGVCGGVFATIQLLDESERAPEARVAEKEPPKEPEPTPTAAPRRTAAPTRTPAPTPEPQRPKPTPTPEPNEPPPAAVSTGSTGNEFDPLPANTQSQPAPAPASGGSEFTP